MIKKGGWAIGMNKIVQPQEYFVEHSTAHIVKESVLLSVKQSNF